jgi:predicted metal-binding membrane protein
VTAVQRWSGRHPEWAATAVALSGWVLLITLLARGHHRHSPDLQHWVAMSVAMMVPSTLPAVRGIAFTSLWSRRHRAAGIFVASYVAVWTAFGAVAIPVRTLLPFGGPTPLAGALVLAAAWELAPAKRRALRACLLSDPIPPRGWKADVGCARAGVVYGRRCVVACWALMLAMLAPGVVSLPLMLLVAGIVGAEKLLVRGTRLTAAASPILLGAAFLVLLG